MKQKTIYVLIGMKGSGKTLIGTLMDQHFDIKFLRVEDWAKLIKGDRNLDDENYIQEVFENIEKGIRRTLQRSNQVVFESTGLTNYFKQMIYRLGEDHNLITIKIEADKQLCLQRIRSRDQSIHIQITDEQVNRINQMVLEQDLKCDYRIVNMQKTAHELLQELTGIVQP